MNLQDKTAIITGAGGGIGRELAYQMAKNGVRLALNDWNEEGLKETVSNIGWKDELIFSRAFDVGDRKAYQSFMDDAVNHFGHVDLLINNAGVSLGRYKLEEVKEEDLEWILNINLMSYIHSTRYFIDHLKNRPEAYLVYLSSVFGLAGIKAQFPYCVSKFAVRGFGESLRWELMDSNVNVLNVHPGGIKTGIVSNGRMKEEEKGVLDVQFDEIMARTTAEDAAKQIVNAIKRNKQRLLIGRDARMLDIVLRLFPVSYYKLLDRLQKWKGLDD